MDLDTKLRAAAVVFWNGFGLIVVDVVQSGTVLIGFFGALLMLSSAYWSRRKNRAEALRAEAEFIKPE